MARNRKADSLDFGANCRAWFYVEIKYTYGNNVKAHIISLGKKNRADCLGLPCLFLPM